MVHQNTNLATKRMWTRYFPSFILDIGDNYVLSYWCVLNSTSEEMDWLTPREGLGNSSPCWSKLPLEPELCYHCATSPSPWGGEGLISFYTPRKQFITGRHQGRISRKELQQNTGRMLLTGSSLWLAQLSFLHSPGQLAQEDTAHSSSSPSISNEESAP